MALPKRDKKAGDEPKVGIFWLFKGKLIIDSTPLSDAEPYGDSLGHAIGHIDHWAVLQKRAAVPSEVEYEEPPRGRVVYDKREARFHLLADRCILAHKDLIEKIKHELNLPENTKLGTDLQYRCPKCLYGEGTEEDWDF
jgi:hypothetical protein